MANYVSSVDEYIKNIITDVLPPSDLARIQVNPSGLVRLDNTNSTEWSIELPDSVGAGLYAHEKSSTTRVGILTNRDKSTLNPVYHSSYFKPFGGTLMRVFDSLIAQSILELYPMPVQTYGAIQHDSIISGGVVDLNHLRTKDSHLNVKTMRLDMFLALVGLGKEINSFIDLQNFMKNPVVKEFLSDRAIVQVALESFAMPNAVGEVDANSRNVLILFDPITGKGEYVARIDAESNTYFNNRNNERSGKNVLPKGILHGNEFFESEFLKEISQRNTSIDWDLFASITNLAHKLTSRDYVDSAVFGGYRRNYHRVPNDMIRESSPAYTHFGAEAYKDFSEKTIDRAERYHKNIFAALGARRSSEAMPFGTIKADKPNMLEQIPFNSKGQPLSPEEEAEYGLQ